MTVSSLFVFLFIQFLWLLVQTGQIGENFTLVIRVVVGTLVLAKSYIISIVYWYRNEMLTLAFHVWLHETWYLKDLVLTCIFEMC